MPLNANRRTFVRQTTAAVGSASFVHACDSDKVVDLLRTADGVERGGDGGLQPTWVNSIDSRRAKRGREVSKNEK